MCKPPTLYGTKFPHKNIHKYTRQSSDRSTRNQIDHFLISKKFLGSLMDVKTIRGADIYSDHQLLVGVIRLRPAAIHPQSKSKQRYNIQRLQDNDIVDEFATRLSHNLANTNYSNDSWTNIAEACKQSAEEILGYTHHHGKPWIREATWRQIDHRKRLKTELAQARTAADKQRLREEYNYAEQQVKKMARADSRHFYNIIASEAEEASAVGDMRGVYSAINKLRGESRRSWPPLKDCHGRVLTTEKEQLDRWKEYLESPFQDNIEFIPLERQERRNPRRDISTAPPNTEDIVNAINKLKNNKAPGYDNLPAELFKYNVSTLATALTPVMRDAWLNCKIPGNWKDGAIITIPKKETLAIVKTGGASFSSTLSKKYWL